MEAVAYIDINAPLVERCRLNDRQAQAELYRRYSKAMFNVALRITSDYAEAEDVLQESFLSAFRELSGYKGDSSFGAWLKRIVVNKSINCLRQRRLQLVPLEDFHHDAAPPEAAVPHSRDEEDDMQYRADVLRRCVQELPDGYRVVLSLYLLEGYDHLEIAGILGITESTSKSQYSRARTRLRELAMQRGLS
ncbi:MAG: sigma-70 family RNA polymerase sigma factor [Hymenobacter sp.]|nr:MAG: sigma-70 family RNA polymerase sigma factor [Hymenobacter sp.]